MNEFKNNIIILIMLSLTFIICFLFFYKIDNNIKCNIIYYEDEWYIESSQKILNTYNSKIIIYDNEYRVNLNLIVIDGKEKFLYKSWNLNEIKINNVKNVVIVDKKISLFEFILSYLKKIF